MGNGRRRAPRGGHGVPGRGSRRRDGVRRLLAGSATAVVVAGLLFLGVDQGYPATRPHLLSGAAWVASAAVGQLTLLDGSSAEVAAQARVAERGDQLDVVQQAATAYAVNRSAGTIRRVDGSTFDVSPPASPLPQAGAGLLAFASAGTLYAVDSRRGLVTSADPKTLTSLGTTTSMATQVDLHAAVLDGSGRLWVLDSGTGDLVWIDHGQRWTRRGAAHPGGGRLVLADGAPVIVDTVAGTATAVDPDSGAPRTTVGLDLRPGDRIEVGGSARTPRIYVVAARGVLDICDLTAQTCATAIPLGAADGDLGSPVEAGGRLFVPDYATGRVWIIDLAGSRVVAKPQVLDPHTRFQVLTRDGVVFFNDPNSEHAGVIRLDGGVRTVAKYNPRNPSKGLTGNAATEPADQHPKPKPPPKVPAPKPSPSAKDDTPVVQIVVSKAAAQVGEDISLQVVVDTGPVPVSARWTFGDGQGGTGIVTTHHWNAEQVYQIGVQATLANLRTMTASTSIQVTNRHFRLTVAVPANGMVTGGGIGCPATCSITTLAGQSIDLLASPAPGFAFVRWSGACTDTTPTCTVVMTGDIDVAATFVVLPPPKLPAPVLTGPGDGALFLTPPRTTTVTWQAVTGATQYDVEVQRDAGPPGGWVPEANTTVTGTGTTFTFSADGPGRWRVTAIASDGTPGNASAWRTFRYDTELAGFVGNWHSTSSASFAGVWRLNVVQTSENTATMHGFGACTPECDWGTTTGTLSGGVLHGIFDVGFETLEVWITKNGTKLSSKLHTDDGGIHHLPDVFDTLVPA